MRTYMTPLNTKGTVFCELYFKQRNKVFIQTHGFVHALPTLVTHVASIPKAVPSPGFCLSLGFPLTLISWSLLHKKCMSKDEKNTLSTICGCFQWEDNSGYLAYYVNTKGSPCSFAWGLKIYLKPSLSSWAKLFTPMTLVLLANYSLAYNSVWLTWLLKQPDHKFSS